MPVRIKKAKKGEVMVEIKSPNNKIVATTETYKKKQAAINAINAIKKEIKKPIIDKTKKISKKK